MRRGNIPVPIEAFFPIVLVGMVSPVILPAGRERPARRSILRMSLEAILKTVIVNLRSGRLEREEDVKLAVILPILQALDWNPADPGSLRPEYPVSSGRVDYALLCHGRPQVFVEAKRSGALDVRAEAQLFGYAVNNGVPLLVLSDGRYWDFYLSMADGPPVERRFHRLELRDEDWVPEYAEMLETWLCKRQVASGEARRSAEDRLEGDRSRMRAREAMPEAWNALLSEPDGLLCDLLADKVKGEVGVTPRLSDVEEFLRRLPSALPLSTPAVRPPTRRGERPAGREPRLGVETAASPAASDSSTRDITAIGAVHGHGEGFQDVVYDLMRTLLEDYPALLNGETIGYLETTTNPLGTKLSYPLIRRRAEGRILNGHARYKKDLFADRWHVCTEWNKQHHRHNARKLAEWVESLIAGAEDAGAKDRLLNVVNRLSVHSE